MVRSINTVANALDHLSMVRPTNILAVALEHRSVVQPINGLAVALEHLSVVLPINLGSQSGHSFGAPVRGVAYHRLATALEHLYLG